MLMGKIKIPLGDAYLIREAAKPTDVGSLASHGCVRMLTESARKGRKKGRGKG